MLSDWLTTQEAAKILGVKPDTMATWRWRGRGPKYIQHGKHRNGWPKIAYKHKTIAEFLKSRSND